MPKNTQAKRNARPSATDDRVLEIALLALATFRSCCGDGTDPSAPHENSCAIGSANHLLEYHAGILSRRPRAWDGESVYGGELSNRFWNRVNATTDEELQSKLYKMGVVLQNHENDMLAALAEAEGAG